MLAAPSLGNLTNLEWNIIDLPFFLLDIAMPHLKMFPINNRFLPIKKAVRFLSLCHQLETLTMTNLEIGLSSTNLSLPCLWYLKLVAVGKALDLLPHFTLPALTHLDLHSFDGHPTITPASLTDLIVRSMCHLTSLHVLEGFAGGDFSGYIMAPSLQNLETLSLEQCGICTDETVKLLRYPVVDGGRGYLPNLRDLELHGSETDGLIAEVVESRLRLEAEGGPTCRLAAICITFTSTWDGMRPVDSHRIDEAALLSRGTLTRSIRRPGFSESKDYKFC